MTRPALKTWIEETNDFSGFGIDAREIGPLVCVIVMAGQGKVFRIIGPTVLLGNDMLYVQAVKWLVILMDPAVLAPMACPTPDKLTSPGIHHLRSDPLKSLRAFAWMMAR
jgi:hypothetical protein